MANCKEYAIAVLANAAVLVSFPGVRVLVDGLYRPQGPAKGVFDAVPSPLLERLLAGDAPFGHIDHLLFTHAHSDHFSAAETLAYLRGNSPQALVLPPDALAALARENGPQGFGAGNMPVQAPKLHFGETLCMALAGGLRLTAGNTGHMGEQYADVAHYAYLLESHGKRVLVTGDTAVDERAKNTILRITEGQPVDALFVTPLFFNHGQATAILHEVAKPRLVLVYHVPFGNSADGMGVRRRAQRILERHERQTPPVLYQMVVCTEPNQAMPF